MRPTQRVGGPSPSQQHRRCRRVACIPALEMMLQADADWQHQDGRGETARARAFRDGFDKSVATIDLFFCKESKQAIKSVATIDLFFSARKAGDYEINPDVRVCTSPLGIGINIKSLNQFIRI